MIYPGGSKCSSGFERMTIINFECNKNACENLFFMILSFYFECSTTLWWGKNNSTGQGHRYHDMLPLSVSNIVQNFL